ncbi:Methyltransferase-like protein [Thalictrum thalictroides]|uniref:Methyltransferase-like protein n=1 Tax=Thalictrum thalictroides TaxID=46969 RepID=A0A7J6VKG6_THATH|nr:Methyltransferase-like protein [Thalictrum thalictroides]
MEEEYGMFVWPCSIALAEYVWQQGLRFSGGVSVVELGAGTSLPGLVAAKMGSHVTLTDNSTRLEVLGNMKKMCALNKINCQLNIAVVVSKVIIDCLVTDDNEANIDKAVEFDGLDDFHIAFFLYEMLALC